MSVEKLSGQAGSPTEPGVAEHSRTPSHASSVNPTSIGRVRKRRSTPLWRRWSRLRLRHPDGCPVCVPHFAFAATASRPSGLMFTGRFSACTFVRFLSAPGTNRSPVPDCGPCTVKTDPVQTVALRENGHFANIATRPEAGGMSRSGQATIPLGAVARAGRKSCGSIEPRLLSRAPGEATSAVIAGRPAHRSTSA
jgi:hypothetical protein